MLVVIAHCSHDEFSTGIRNTQILGDIAVPVFFVLSGFVIRFVTLSRKHTARDFFIDRASRIYSVAIPALMLTLFVTAIQARILGVNHFAAFSNQPFTRIVLNLTLLSQSWSHSTVAFCNPPFWSLSYEGLYYIAYGIFFYMRGRSRIIALFLWAVFAGPQVIFLLPVWWLGCWLYDLFQILRRSHVATLLRSLSALYLVVALVLYRFGHSALLVAPVRADLAFAALRNPLTLLHLNPYRATLLAVGTGALASFFILILLLTADLIPVARGNAWIRRFRIVADGTFSIYLMHFPLLVLAASLGLFHHGANARNIAIVALLCAALILLARPLDQLKRRLRDLLQACFQARPRPSSANSIPAWITPAPQSPGG